MNTTQTLHEYLAQKRHIVEQALEESLSEDTGTPPLLLEAMRYSVFAGGKRLRPIMLLMTAEMLGQECQAVTFAAAALEIIHTYSLVHDDLPAMDNDDLRRGRPTNHIVYGEGMAILAGDALFTRAFQIMSDPKCGEVCSPSAQLQAMYELAEAAGACGMIGGQVLDILAEGQQITGKDLEQIHTLKTGKMITSALRIGAILSNAAPQQLEAVTMYGELVGLAFQIVDDILDIEGNADELGKFPASDLHKQKATYPALYGLNESKRRVRTLIHHAKQALRIFEEGAYYFYQLADYMQSRTN